MRIAIVNDMMLALEALRRVLIAAGEHHVAWTARSGAEAIELCAKDRPDLILLDLFMPGMDGVETTRRIMAQTPCPILVITANVQDHAPKVFEAMGAGAVDAVNTPVLSGAGNLDGARHLLAKIDTIRRLVSPVTARKAGPAHAVTRPPEARVNRLVVIGASAGGPAALAKILADLPADFPAAVGIVQHVDMQFAPGLADWLGGHTALRVRLAEEGDHPEAGTVLLAGKDYHLVLTASRRWGYLRAPADCSHRPSVDVLFQSVSQHWKDLAVGVLLTGMGRDGATGLRALRKHGFHTIAQDQTSSSVYGMPKAAVDLDAATEILALDKIGPRLTNIMTARR